jgi:hypothetical protein
MLPGRPDTASMLTYRVWAAIAARGPVWHGPVCQSGLTGRAGSDRAGLFGHLYFALCCRVFAVWLLSPPALFHSYLGFACACMFPVGVTCKKEKFGCTNMSFLAKWIRDLRKLINNFKCRAATRKQRSNINPILMEFIQKN